MPLRRKSCQPARRPSNELARIFLEYLNTFAYLLVISLLVLCSASTSCETRAQPLPQAVITSGQSPSVTPLALGQSIRREIKQKEAHRFRLDLISGQYARVVVQREGIDLVVRMLDSDSKVLWVLGNPAGARANITFSLLGTTTGDYLFEIAPADVSPPPGAYEITLVEVRNPTSNDNERLTAEKLYAEARQEKQKEIAERKYASAIAHWHAIGDVFEEANTWQSQANFHKALGQLIDTEFENARRLRQQAGDQEGEAYTLNDWAAAQRDYGKPSVARGYYTEALTRFQTVHNRLGEASSLSGIAFCDALMGNMQAALASYQQVLPIRRELHDRMGEARVLNAIGGTYEWLAEPQAALLNYEQALSIWREIGDRENEANTRNNIGVYYAGHADWQQALEHYRYALEIYAQYAADNLSIQRKKADTLDNVALIYESMNAPDRALSFLEEALTIRKRLGQNRGLGFTEACYGFAYYLLGDLDQSVAHYEKAIDYQQNAQDSRIAQTYTILGMIYSKNASQKALNFYDKALVIQKDEKTRDPAGQAITLDQKGSLYDLIGNSQKADDCFAEALAIWKSLEDPQGEATARYHLALSYNHHDQFDKAAIEVKQALTLIESLRSKVAGYELRMKYFSANADLYGLAVDTELQLYRHDHNSAHEQNAFLFAEAGRSRVLRDILSDSATASGVSVADGLVKQERDLQYLLDAKYALRTRLALRNAPTQQRSYNNQEISRLSAEYDEVLARLRNQKPRNIDFVHSPQPTLEEIQKELDSDTALIEYALGEKRSYAWRITQNGVKSFELPARKKIEDLAISLAANITARNATIPQETIAKRTARLQQTDDNYSKAASELARMILDPVVSSIPAKRLIVVTEGALQFIPFKALPSAPGAIVASGPSPSALGLLNEKFEIGFLPSASTLLIQRQALAMRSAPLRTLALFADPVFNPSDRRIKSVRRVYPTQPKPDGAASSDGSRQPKPDIRGEQMTRAFEDIGLTDIPWLPYSRTEAEAIMRVVPAERRLVALDFNASRANVMKPEIRTYGIIHFATHGVIDLEHPEFSGIILSMVDEKGRPQDGYLRLYEITRLDLPADLIVLSACQTGVGKQINGEGVMALADGFIRAGARSVVASLWKVDDAATAALMGQFYKEMFVNKLKPAAALRAAQIKISKQKPWQAPYFWAGFVLQGDWR